MADDEDEQDYDDTIDENAFLVEVSRSYSSPAAFLERNERVFTRSIKVNRCISDVWLDYETDIDGCVVELHDLTGVELPIRHITICPYGAASLKPLKGVLKKHVRVSEYSNAALSNFNDSCGMQLFYENGWECWVGLIPKEEERTTRLNKDAIRHLSLEAFEKVRFDFAKNLARYAAERIALRTLMKNDLKDLKKVFVLPDDVGAVLRALQRALECVNVREFRLITFCFRFGEKMQSGLSLSMFRPEYIDKVTVHAALDISSSVPSVHLLWSMTGIQQVIGTRGTLSTCLSFADCGNFQSNLDGRALDVKPQLRRVCAFPEKLHFVQLYADTPHLRPKTRFHPVSGVIAGGLCFPPNMSAAFLRDADKYISAMEHNFGLLRTGSCRLEIVTELGEINASIEAETCIDMCELYKLLEGHAMLVPIPCQTLECIREIGLWLCKELRDMFNSYKKTGNINAIWRSYQFELACEKLLWGRPLCNKSARYSVNLGPGLLGASRSLTDERGFLALEAYTSCMQYENSIPIYTLWTSSQVIGKCMARACGLHDHLDASYPVVGRLLVLALLKDLYEFGKVSAYGRFEQFLASLKAEDSQFEEVGAISYMSLVQLLSMKRRLSLPMVFGRLCELVTEHQLPLQTVVEAGIVELELKVFPAVETHDTHGNAILKWNFRRKFWTIIHYISPDSPSSPEVFTQLARGELERRRLIFPSRLKKLPAVWPWIAPCLAKISREKLSEEATVTTLAFLSALAFQMQGWFVDFDCFATLFADLPLAQFRLKTLEIQSKLELPNFRFQGLKIFRLHERIPHRIPLENVAIQKPTRVVDEEKEETVMEEGESRRISEDDQLCDSRQLVETRTSTCFAVGLVKPAWSGREIEILHKVHSETPAKSVKELYWSYRTECMKRTIPFRTFIAFKRKLSRLT